MGQARSERKKIAAAANWAKLRILAESESPFQIFPAPVGGAQHLMGIQPPVRASGSFIDAVRQMPRAFDSSDQPERWTYDGSFGEIAPVPSIGVVRMVSTALTMTSWSGRYSRRMTRYVCTTDDFRFFRGIHFFLRVGDLLIVAAK